MVQTLDSLNYKLNYNLVVWGNKLEYIESFRLQYSVARGSMKWMEVGEFEREVRGNMVELVVSV